ncbi:oxidoreductase [Actinomyces johnsonii]|uniref:oxidoreductase n=1 Tax=Actinomyces johnsonii TaxID=544581 RepID=UPI000683EA98
MVDSGGTPTSSEREPFVTTTAEQAPATVPQLFSKAPGTRVVLVTGASSGIGADTARRLQALGYIVYGAARRTDRLQALTADGIRPLAMDVTDDASMTSGVNRLLEETGRIDILVNNAGYGSYGAIEDVPIDEARRQFEVNVFGLARLTQLVSPHMRTRGSGTIINISSIGGRLTTPLGGWYHATKYAVEALSDALRMELRPFGIDVVVVEPGGIRTEWASIAADHLEATAEGSAYADQIRAVAGAMRSESNARRYSPPEVIARTVGKIVTARRPRTRYAVGFMAKPLIAARRVLPDRAFDRLISAAFGIRR